MKRLMMMLVACGLCVGASAEMRTWKLKNGQTVEAEYVRFFFDKIMMKGADGKELSIPKDEFDLSAADQEYLDLENPPVLDLSFRKSIEKKNFSMITGSENRPPEWRATFGAKVVQKNSIKYNYALTVEFFAIGKEIKGNRFILLDRKSGSFTPSKENKLMTEFYSKRVVRMTDLWDGSTSYSRRGEQYFGFLISVKDKRGKVIALDASNKWLEEHLDNLEKLKIGNYMDDTCIRTFPSRPKSYVANQAAGRS